MHVRCPELVEVVRQYVSENGIAAQEKRRSEEGTCGVSMDEILAHVRKTLPSINVTGSTVRRLFFPRKANTIAAKRFYKLIDCKVPRIRNDGRRKHPDGHFCFAQIALVMEWAAKNYEEVEVVSQDDMHYILVHCFTLGNSRIFFLIQRKKPNPRILSLCTDLVWI